ncbi:MAG: hypothetical protein ACFNPT_10435, partial [Neisseria elongata]
IANSRVGGRRGGGVCGSGAWKFFQTACALHKLLMPHEMGELFKVIAFGRNIGIDWQGFAHGDICHKL